MMERIQNAGNLPNEKEILEKAGDVCPVQWAAAVCKKAHEDCCGRGVFCRDGLKELYLIAEDITSGRGTMEDIELLQLLSKQVMLGADCDAAYEGARLMSLSIETHYDDWTAHVLRKRCKAGQCAGMKKGGAGAASAGIQIDIPTGSSEGYAEVALSRTSAFDLGGKPLARKKKNRPHLCQPEKPIDPNAPEITETVGPNTVVRKDGRIIRRYRTNTGIVSE